MSSSFDWQAVELGADDIRSALLVLRDRYDAVEIAAGIEAWKAFVATLAEMQWPQADVGDHRLLTVAQDALAKLFAQLAFVKRPRWRRVFISHRRSDAIIAERMASLVSAHGYAHWLDIHDPMLLALSSSTAPPALVAVLVAAVIEMALLNCTHVVAMRSKNAKGSDWIPYEFGRVKSRHLCSIDAATWLGKGVAPPEYAYLAPVLRREAEAHAWLGGYAPPYACSAPPNAFMLDGT